MKAIELDLKINTIIEVWEFNHGEIDTDKSLHFEIEETAATFKVRFKFITAVIPIPEPERDDTIWDEDFFTILKTGPVKKLIHYVNDILLTVSEMRIGSVKETPFDI